MTMQLRALAALAGGLALAAPLAPVGCSSTPAATGDDGGAANCTATDVNPDGVAYPCASYGRTARSGSTPGSVIQNFKFQGYLNGDSTQPLTTIALADYYDPCNKRYKLVHLSVAGVWCQPCNQETTAVVADLASSSSVLKAAGAVFLQALDDGPTEGVPATTSDLDYWVKNHNSNFTTMLDPGLQNLGGFFNPASVPWNADIDARTMEILAASTGWLGDVSSEIAAGVAALPATPGYPLPAGVTCSN